jgi:hypothetical protein
VVALGAVMTLCERTASPVVELQGTVDAGRSLPLVETGWCPALRTASDPPSAATPQAVDGRWAARVRVCACVYLCVHRGVALPQHPGVLALSSGAVTTRPPPPPDPLSSSARVAQPWSPLVVLSVRFLHKLYRSARCICVEGGGMLSHKQGLEFVIPL